jgi:dephospho-CoA kinase
MQRSQLTGDEVRSIIAQQAPRERRLACADSVIYNEGIDLAALKNEVTLWARRFGL